MSADSRTSQCILCGRIWYSEIVEKCPRCGGLCWSWRDADTWLMHRRGDRMDSNAMMSKADVAR